MSDEKLPANFAKHPEYKDYKPGTFTINKKPVVRGVQNPLERISKVGKEISVNREIEEVSGLAKLGGLAEEVGIKITETAGGLTVTLPPELLEQGLEEERKKNEEVLEAEKIRRETLEKKIPLLVRFGILKNEMGRLGIAHDDLAFKGTFDAIEKYSTSDNQTSLALLEESLDSLENKIKSVGEAQTKSSVVDPQPTPATPKPLPTPETRKKRELNIPAVGECIAIFSKNRGSHESLLPAFIAWEKKWLESGALDKYRANYSNIKVSDEQVESIKNQIKIYKKILEKDALGEISNDVARSVEGNIITLAKILTGIHHDEENDIRYLVEHFDKASDDALIAKLESYLTDRKNTPNKEEGLTPQSQEKQVALRVRFGIAEKALQKINTDALDGDTQQRLIDLLTSITTLETSKKESDVLELESKIIELESEIKTLEENEKTKIEEEKRNTLEKASQEKPLDVASLWPPYVYFDKSKGGKNAWVTTLHGKIEVLPNTAAWTAEEANTKPVFAEYFKFIQDQNPAYRKRKVELYRTLIEAKNAVISAINEGDIEKVSILREQLRTLTEESKEAWNKVLEADKKLLEKGAIKKEKLEAFEKQKKRLTQLSAQALSLLQEITTEDGKMALRSMGERITRLEGDLDDQFNKGEVNENDSTTFNSYLDTYAKVIEQADTRLTKINPLHRSVLRSPLNEKAKGRTIRERSTGEVISVSDWLKKQEEAEVARKQEKVQKEERAGVDLKVLHREMYEDNKEAYKDIYLDKVFVRGDKNKEARDAIFGEEILRLKHERAEKVGQVVELDKRHSPDNTEDDERRINEDISILQRRINEIDNEIGSFSDNPAVMAKNERIRKELERKSLTENRATYSPELDDSIADIPVAGKPKPSFWNNWEEAKRIAIAKGHRKQEMESLDATHLTPQEVRNLQPDTVHLSDKEHPNHYDGMVTPLNGVIHTPEEEVESAPTTQEQLSSKQKAVQKMLATLERMFVGDWKKYSVPAVATLAVAGALTAYSLRQKEDSEVTKTTPTLEAQVPKLENWKVQFVNEKERDFLRKFIGDKELSFVDLMQDQAKSVEINKSNIATLTTLSTWDTGELVGETPQMAGLTDEQRAELCAVVKQLDNIITKAETYLKKAAAQNLTTFTPLEYKHIRHNVTLLDLYESARKAARQAELLASK